jgi:DNA-binding transcriptional ArsR family regulator
MTRAVSISQIGVKSRMAYLRRLSVVFADELRIRIVSELNLREMSPSQFFSEFGGGSVSRVDRHFQKLVEHGWLRLVREETGGKRRGATEHFYRATELAVFDNETWALVPYPVRVAYSWKTFNTFAERVRHALGTGTLDARADSHLSLTTLVLDELGWERVMAAIDAFFTVLSEEQEDAKIRLARTGETPIHATVGLAGFESPGRGGRPTGPALIEVRRESPFPFPLRVSKVLADELCVMILAEASLREISPPLFQAEIGGASVEVVRRRFRMLQQLGWLTKVTTKTGGRRRGAAEQFYRATGPMILDSDAWSKIPASVKPTHSWAVFNTLAEKVKEAILAGTFEARLDNHLSWSGLRLDGQGWTSVASQVDALLAVVLKEKDRAEDELADSGDVGILATVGLAAFESPEDLKAP